MLIEQIREDMNRARQGDDPVAKSLLVTLFSEATRVGKDKRNGATTDEEVVGVVRKFAANAEETRRLLEARGQSTLAQSRELALLAAYMPQQMTEQELKTAVEAIVARLGVSGGKAMGQVMAALKEAHGGKYDGKMASQVVKAVLG